MSNKSDNALKLLSHHSLLTLHGCPRNFELVKRTGKGMRKDRSVHLDFGTVVGSGCAEFLRTRNLNDALMKVFLGWEESIESDEGERSRKTFWHALNAVELFASYCMKTMTDYELIYLSSEGEGNEEENIPAIELGVKILFPDGFSYRSFFDAILFNKRLNIIIPVDFKTTASREPNEASYKNSGQLLGYAIFLQFLIKYFKLPVAETFKIMYLVFSTPTEQWLPFVFTKSMKSRATWIKATMLDMERISEYMKQEMFPQHGEHCFSFGRTCRYFDLCQLSNSSMGIHEDDAQEDSDRYHFTFNIDEIIKDLIETKTETNETEEQDVQR
jgi:hypothetical protein